MLNIKFGFEAKTVVWPIPFLINMFTALQGSQFYFYLIGQAVSKETMFEYHGNIHVYCRGLGADEPLGLIFFQNH